jgi:hypothetical protein
LDSAAVLQFDYAVRIRRDKNKNNMTREQIIAAIDDEIGRLQQVKKLLQSAGGHGIAGVSSAKTAPKRILSPEARQRIAAAQKRRWAKQRKETATPTAKK